MRRYFNNNISRVLLIAGILLALVLIDTWLRKDEPDAKTPVIVLTGENAMLSADSVAVHVSDTVSISIDYFNGSARWSSYDESIATIDQDGVITGISEGKTCVFAECGDYMLTAIVNVISDEEM